MISDNERRDVARRLRDEAAHGEMHIRDFLGALCSCIKTERNAYRALLLLADLIEPSYKLDAEYEAWYNSLSHCGSAQNEPSTLRKLIEEIVWVALTVDLGPNGNTAPSTGVDEGDVYTDKLFAVWEREALRLSGGVDREGLLELVDEMERSLGRHYAEDHRCGKETPPSKVGEYARRIREALGEL